MQNEKLTIGILQYDIAWEDKSKNISYISNTIASVAGEVDLVVLPEMCTTAFTFAKTMAESPEGETITQLKAIAKQQNISICGSLLITEEGRLYNRGFFITPTDSYYYDKRHLFRMGREGETITAGNKKTIINYKGFNICLLICYDLRFPVWARNRNNEYDMLIYVANWPESRKKVWNTLLKARAIENMSYVCGVNRIGIDNNNLNHAGGSMMINLRGEEILSLAENKETVGIVTIDKETLMKDRTHFPVWKDADNFEINI